MENIINLETDFTINKEKHRNAKPFPHTIFDNFLKPEIAEELEKVFPDPQKDFWLKYDNPLEVKLQTNALERIPPKILDALEYLNSTRFLAALTQLTEIKDLVADPGFHGGGMHCTKSGGKLDVHIDYSIHPKLGLERRLNLILFLNKEWKEEYGGTLELWDKGMEHCVTTVSPKFNRAVLFETGDDTFHGHPEPTKCPENISRKSLALYYLTKPRENATKRYKARFVKRPQDPDDPELEKLRELRAGLNTSQQFK
jgi:hypothetical protein